MKYLFILISLNSISLFSSETSLEIIYYGEIGCGHCDLFEKKILPGIEERTGVEVKLQAYDILNPGYYKECEESLSRMGIEFTIFPVLFVGNNAYLGNSAVENGLFEELIYYKKNGNFRPLSRDLSLDSGSVTLSAIPVFIAGIIDGINPCAFATLIFFISFLSIQGRTKREILFTGMLFTLSVFFAYLLLGFGLLNTVRFIIDFSIIRFIMKLGVSIAAGVFLILSLYDYHLARSGRFDEITLQLSLPLKKRLHRIIRRNNGKKFLAGGVIITGFTVSVIELACTGQVYLPTIAYMVQTDNSFLGIQSLLIYNTGFILPLIAVFGAVYTGISSKILSGLLTRKIHHVKMLLAAFFMFLAVVIWFV